ncbi:MAG: MarR family transcriptional regulator [Hyphomicrobiales bacterium]|nr:MarR family transcriptional regulator [Hyphomicrobiales bacterium]
MTGKSRRKEVAPELEDGDYAALASFRRALRVFLAFSADAAREAGLTPQQHQAILAVRGFAPAGGMTINDLAEQLLLKPQTAVELVDRLEKADLVQRRRDGEDRRKVLLMLTARADAVLAPLSEAHLAQIGRDAQHLIALLEQMLDHPRSGASRT